MQSCIGPGTRQKINRRITALVTKQIQPAVILILFLQNVLQSYVLSDCPWLYKYVFVYVLFSPDRDRVRAAPIIDRRQNRMKARSELVRKERKARQKQMQQIERQQSSSNTLGIPSPKMSISGTLKLFLIISPSARFVSSDETNCVQYLLLLLVSPWYL